MATALANPYVDEDGVHIGCCNACGAEVELGHDCTDCTDGEVVPYADDPDPTA